MTEQERVKRAEERGFYHGIIAALAVIESFDAETIFHHVVATVDEALLVKIARRNGDMR